MQRRIPAYHLYGEAPRRIDETTLHIETIEARSARHQWRIAPHRHRSLHQLLFVQRGGGTALVENRRTQFRSPTLLVVPAGAVHGFEFEPGTRGQVISLSTDLLREIARLEADVDELFQHPATIGFPAEALRDTELPMALRILAREHPRALAGRRLALSGALEIVLAGALRLSRAHRADGLGVAGDRRLLVARYTELVERDFRLDRPLEAFAAALRVPASRLRRACLAVTGQSPVQILHGRLLLEAQRQLLYTDATVREIAYALGFEDAAYFTRFFSRRSGLSPRAFRLRGPMI